MSETNKKKPLYQQLKEHILEDYKNQPYHTPLPGERALCDIYHVSRPTVRKALELLEEDGCITRFPGKGAFFIGECKIENGKKVVSSAIALYNQAKLRGNYTHSRVLTQRIELADDRIAENLSIQKGSKIFHLERLRYINGDLWLHSDAYLDYALCPKIVDCDYTIGSLHNTLSAHGHIPFKAKRHITVQHADDYIALHLNLPKESPICVTETHTYDQNGIILEYVTDREDVFHISFDLEVSNQLDITDSQTGSIPGFRQ